jgi:hypothetical protein
MEYQARNRKDNLYKSWPKRTHSSPRVGNVKITMQLRMRKSGVNQKVAAKTSTALDSAAQIAELCPPLPSDGALLGAFHGGAQGHMETRAFL